MNSMTNPGQQLDGAAKRSGRVRAAKATVSEPLLARESQGQSLHAATTAAIDAAGRHSLIAESAYLRAERRGFAGGCCETDWLEAEQEVDRQLIGQGLEGARCGD
jgi:hypothetical protein